MTFERYINSRCREPNSDRIDDPPDAQPQFLLLPLEYTDMYSIKSFAIIIFSFSFFVYHKFHFCSTVKFHICGITTFTICKTV